MSALVEQMKWCSCPLNVPWCVRSISAHTHFTLKRQWAVVEVSGHYPSTQSNTTVFFIDGRTYNHQHENECLIVVVNVLWHPIALRELPYKLCLRELIALLVDSREMRTGTFVSIKHQHQNSWQIMIFSDLGYVKKKPNSKYQHT